MPTTLKRTIVCLGLLALLLAPALTFAQTAQNNVNSDDLGLEFKGIVQTVPEGGLLGDWEIGEKIFIVDATTIFPRGTPSVGSCVEVEYVDAGGRNRAREIELDNDCNGGDPEGPDAYGLIEAFPETLFGGWQINGLNYEARSGTTTFEQDYGPFAVGQCVEVYYQVEGAINVATKIETKPAFKCSGADREFKAYGLIKALPDSANLIGTWTIGGRDFEVTADTELEDGPFTVGMLVEIHFVRAANGALTATHIEGKHRVPEHVRKMAKAYGEIGTLPSSTDLTGEWTIADNTYVVDSATRLKPENGPFEIGACVKIHYRIGVDNTRTAFKIETEPAEKCADLSGWGKIYGFVEQMPPDGFMGAWVVGGITFEARDTTKFEQERGVFEVGAFVEVKFVVIDGVRVATKIETYVPPGAGKNEILGRLSFGGNGAAVANQTWYVAGQPYQITDATILDDQQAELAEGQPVSVNFYTDSATGARVATQVTALTNIYNVYLPNTQR